MTVPEEKRALRREMRARAAALPPSYFARAGLAIAGRVAALSEYAGAGTVFAFVGTGRESDTRPLLERVLRDGKRLVLPLCTGPGEMQCRAVAALAALRPGAYGIPEPPPNGPLVPPGEIDLAVVPCLCCDRSGGRLGKGGGYYDRFLAVYRGPALAVCPARLLAQAVPMEPLDRPVGLVVTELEVIRPDICAGQLHPADGFGKLAL